jgi:hypothetical protein
MQLIPTVVQIVIGLGGSGSIETMNPGSMTEITGMNLILLPVGHGGRNG